MLCSNHITENKYSIINGLTVSLGMQNQDWLVICVDFVK